MSDICEWFTQYIDLAEDVVIIKFSDGTTKTVKRGIYLKEVEDNIRKMLIDQVKDRPTGHWIELPTHESQSGLPWYECSECNSERCIAVLRDFKYCPNCGAKMTESEE